MSYLEKEFSKNKDEIKTFEDKAQRLYCPRPPTSYKKATSKRQKIISRGMLGAWKEGKKEHGCKHMRLRYGTKDSILACDSPESRAGPKAHVQFIAGNNPEEQETEENRTGKERKPTEGFIEPFWRQLGSISSGPAEKPSKIFHLKGNREEDFSTSFCPHLAITSPSSLPSYGCRSSEQVLQKGGERGEKTWAGGCLV